MRACVCACVRVHARTRTWELCLLAGNGMHFTHGTSPCTLRQVSITRSQQRHRMRTCHHGGAAVLRRVHLFSEGSHLRTGVLHRRRRSSGENQELPTRRRYMQILQVRACRIAGVPRPAGCCAFALCAVMQVPDGGTEHLWCPVSRSQCWQTMHRLQLQINLDLRTFCFTLRTVGLVNL